MTKIRSLVYINYIPNIGDGLGGWGREREGGVGEGGGGGGGGGGAPLFIRECLSSSD
jgi:hypothetical protein